MKKISLAQACMNTPIDFEQPTRYDSGLTEFQKGDKLTIKGDRGFPFTMEVVVIKDTFESIRFDSWKVTFVKTSEGTKLYLLHFSRSAGFIIANSNGTVQANAHVSLRGGKKVNLRGGKKVAKHSARRLCRYAAGGR